MTKKQMISTLRGMDFGSTIGSKGDEALRMAIAELEQQPCDCVSREAVIGAICDYVAYEEYEDKSHTFTIRPLKKRIENLPSATQKSGKWIRWREEVQRGTHYTENIPHCKCSECDTEYDIFASRFINYCPNCGAKMESEE